MKKIRIAACVMMLALVMLCMTGCGDKNNSGQGSTAQTTTSASSESGSTTGGMDQTGQNAGGSESGSTGSTGSSNAAGTNESTSGGVIEGLVDDVERGVDDLTGDSNNTTAAADESR